MYINLAIIIDVRMIRNNILYNNSNSKLLCDDKLNTLHGWFSLDSKYTENEIMKHIMETE